MTYNTYLIKYGEIGCKGKNRYMFEDALVRRIRLILEKVDGTYDIRKEHGRIYVDVHGEHDDEDVLDALKRVFGIVAICPIVMADKNDKAMIDAVIDYIDNAYDDKDFTFKVDTRRADKTYPGTSETVNAMVGEKILEHFPNLRVDVHSPEVVIKIEIRNTISIYSHSISGPGGMPVGTNGSAMLLLSGGIDSPVAGYMIAKRGVRIEAVYFDAPPYTSERARQKVIDLAHLISRYTGPINLHIIDFAPIQLKIYERCPHDELTIIMRRYMMRIAQMIAEDNKDMALITGESIGQVASQTVQSLVTTDAVCKIPVFRPLIGMDKQEIISLSEKIGTYETSIQPYEDCCTIFVAKHPVTKPILHVIEESEKLISEDIDELVKIAISTKKRILCKE